jgi:hypothetical protein
MEYITERSVNSTQMRKKISQQEPWKGYLAQARRDLADNEESPTRRQLGLLALAITEDFIDASFAGDLEALLKCREDLRKIIERLGGTHSPERSLEQALDEALGELEVHIDTNRWPASFAVAHLKGKLTSILQPRRKGAPFTARVRSIKARDLRQKKPQKSWLEIANAKDMCDCGKTQHGKHCAERIRIGVTGLDKFIGSVTRK